MVDLNRGRWAPATRASYETSWHDFVAWCGLRAVDPLPADAKTIADFLTERAETLSTSTLSGRLAAIVAVHTLYGHEVKVKGSIIKDAWSEIRRRKGTANKPKAALVRDDIRSIMNRIPLDRLQDRAVFLIGFMSAMRRSEIVALDLEDLEFTDDALMISIRRSKTDKAGKGAVVCILRSDSDLCAVRALAQWLDHANIGSGPIFHGHGQRRMDPRTVANIVKRWAAKAGYDPTNVAAHSLRRGCITTMFRANQDIKSIMEHSRHKTVSIAMGYVQAETAAKNPALRAVML